MLNALLNKLDAAAASLDTDNTQGALERLQHDVQMRLDGGDNSWLLPSEDQQRLHGQLQKIILALQY